MKNTISIMMIFLPYLCFGQKKLSQIPIATSVDANSYFVGYKNVGGVAADSTFSIAELVAYIGTTSSHNISNSSLTWNGTYTQNGSNYAMFFNNFQEIGFTQVTELSDKLPAHGLFIVSDTANSDIFRAVDGTGITDSFIVGSSTLNPNVYTKINGVTEITKHLNIDTSAVDTVAGSSSGSAYFSMPEQGTGFREVVIYCNALNGTATYNFPTRFLYTPIVVSTSGLATTLVTTLNLTTVTVTGSTSTGIIIVEGR